ncbi:FAD-linked oxidoreductase [Arthrobacter sp. MYb211]|uniref:D-arabinono-1,4-lactone oxidase n=1 Tax=unclassified Arthrobacter TaxID=235627 RepID=UPI000CFD5521|nr:MULTISPECIES: D-arabinono-1,4-lactone oxidase [unclassified Arthrobacter]PRA11884.1 FAD-linked oxidoreductase [Arthrobacter sp. MYb221]PRC08239.1 FAD-linked oxidoreductase [Arthrobacter sp. MYb211]
MKRFANFSRTVSATPARWQSITDPAQLPGVFAKAAKEGHTVRTMGAGHSFTPLVQTSGVLLNLDGFQGIEEVDALTHEVTFRAGTRLWQIPRLLRPYNLALANMGDIDRQSLAGAICTSTHGTGLAFTGFSGMVSGLRITLADGTEMRASPTENAELFQAARVSLGALGVITHVRLRCVPEFMLSAVERVEDIDQISKSFIERSRSTDHLEFFWFSGTSRALVKANTRLPAGSSAPNSPGKVSTWLNDELLSNGALQAICTLGALRPQLIPRLNRLAAAALSERKHTGQWYRVFTSPRRVRFTEMEYALPLESFGTAFAEFRAYLAKAPAPVVFPIEVRTAAADDTWLGTASGRPTVYLAVHRYVRDNVPEYFPAAERILRRHGGRPHWGKEHSLGASQLSALYPRFADFQAMRSTVDPQGLFLNEHLRRLLVEEV